ncbi:glutathione peroxidase 7 [Octopus bimaculoides]|uniref:Glutathione peroxidase n=1 Tax=Octopus bimaculoides TaxID=37653 RepID=A0A0L8I6W3_OCTBM|nr:glutathione peroxidase 7 [Octopus bimaculoides]|eukprot:XP_014790401.1 PREDICTED: glutathione peroxidase 7-like [Octopus bimaculoides]
MTLVRNGRFGGQTVVPRPCALPPHLSLVDGVKTLLSALVAVTFRATTPLATATISVAALVAVFSSLISSSSSSASAALLGIQLADHARASNLRKTPASDSNSVGSDVDGGEDEENAASGKLKNFYSFTAKDINGDTVHLSKYKGKVSLVVNVASECGYTHRNYEALVQMQRTFGTMKFTVLAFPCNQFGEQEPGEDWEIESFAEKLYNINFPIFSKIDVKGPNAANFWKYLTKSTSKEPNWNFWKYLVDTNGIVIKVWSQKTSFSEIYRTVQDVIEGKYKPKHIVHTDL